MGGRFSCSSYEVRKHAQSQLRYAVFNIDDVSFNSDHCAMGRQAGPKLHWLWDRYGMGSRTACASRTMAPCRSSFDEWGSVFAVRCVPLWRTTGSWWLREGAPAGVLEQHTTLALSS